MSVGEYVAVRNRLIEFLPEYVRAERTLPEDAACAFTWDAFVDEDSILIPMMSSGECQILAIIADTENRPGVVAAFDRRFGKRPTFTERLWSLDPSLRLMAIDMCLAIWGAR